MDSSNAASQPLSKRAQKRQMREERNREQRALKKQQKREEKQQLQEQQGGGGGEHEPEWDRLPHEPSNAPRQERKTMLLDSFNKAKSSVTLAIDCAFEDKMTESEKKVCFRVSHRVVILLTQN